MKIKMVHFPIYGIYLVLFKIYAGPQIVQQAYKILILAGILLYLISHVSVRRLLNGSLVFVTAVIAASALGCAMDHIRFTGAMHGILHAMCIYAVYTLLQHCHERGYEKDVIRCFLRITGVYCLISLLSMVVQGNSDEGTSITYFFGNKFATSYYFLLFTALFYTRFWHRIRKRFAWKICYAVLAVFTVCICGWLYCSTAMLSALVLLIVPFLPRTAKRIITKPGVVIICVIAAAMIPFVIVSILENELVQYLVVNVLGENLTLTGRKKIYSMLAQVVMENPILGYGYGNTAVMQAVGFGNAQNGLLQIMVDYGVAGTAGFIWLLFRSLKHTERNESTLGFFMLMYSMIVASIVEISYNYVFFVAVFSLRWLVSFREKSLDRPTT